MNGVVHSDPLKKSIPHRIFFQQTFSPKPATGDTTNLLPQTRHRYDWNNSGFSSR